MTDIRELLAENGLGELEDLTDEELVQFRREKAELEEDSHFADGDLALEWQRRHGKNSLSEWVARVGAKCRKTSEYERAQVAEFFPSEVREEITMCNWSSLRIAAREVKDRDRAIELLTLAYDKKMTVDRFGKVLRRMNGKRPKRGRLYKGTAVVVSIRDSFITLELLNKPPKKLKPGQVINLLMSEAA